MRSERWKLENFGIFFFVVINFSSKTKRGEEKGEEEKVLMET